MHGRHDDRRDYGGDRRYDDRHDRYDDRRDSRRRDSRSPPRRGNGGYRGGGRGGDRGGPRKAFRSERDRSMSPGAWERKPRKRATLFDVLPEGGAWHATVAFTFCMILARCDVGSSSRASRDASNAMTDGDVNARAQWTRTICHHPGRLHRHLGWVTAAEWAPTYP